MTLKVTPTSFYSDLQPASSAASPPPDPPSQPLISHVDPWQSEQPSPIHDHSAQKSEQRFTSRQASGASQEFDEIDNSNIPSHPSHHGRGHVPNRGRPPNASTSIDKLYYLKALDSLKNHPKLLNFLEAARGDKATIKEIADANGDIGKIEHIFKNKLDPTLYAVVDFAGSDQKLQRDIISSKGNAQLMTALGSAIGDRKLMKDILSARSNPKLMKAILSVNRQPSLMKSIIKYKSDNAMLDSIIAANGDTHKVSKILTNKVYFGARYG